MTITRALVGSNWSDAAAQTLTVLNQTTTGYKALVAAVKMENGATTVLSLSDNQSNVWEKVAEISNGNAPRVAIWWCPNPTTNGGDHDFTFSSDATDAEYWRGAVWGVNADGQIVLDDWSEATGSSSTPDAGAVARIATAVYFAIMGEFTVNTISNSQGWTVDASVASYTHFLSRIETGNGDQAATITMGAAVQYAMAAASFREITNTLVKRETFTVASDISLNSYPSGAAEWAAIIGAVNPTVIAARDRVEESGGNGDVYSRFTGTGSPTGHQRIAAQVGFNTTDHSGCLVVRSPDNNNFYLLQRASATLFNVWSYKAGAWSGSPIVQFSKALADVGRVLISFEAETVGSQVTLRAIINGELFSYNDTLSDRILSGRPGAGIYSTSGSTNNYIDNVVVEDLSNITLTISATEGADTSSIPVTVQIPTSGDAQYRHAYGSAPFGSRGWRGTAAAGGNVTLTVSATEGADTSSITAQQTNNATISATEGNDTSSLPVTQVVTVNVAATEGADTSSISGTVQYVANIAATEGADTSSITVQQNNRITVAATEGDDTSSITVEVQGAGPEITIAATEGPDSAAFQTTVTDRLTLTALESDDAAGLTATVTDLLNIAATEADDVSSISVQLAQNITALIQAFESPDASSINIDVEGAVVATGEFMVTIRRRRRS